MKNRKDNRFKRLVAILTVAAIGGGVVNYVATDDAIAAGTNPHVTSTITKEFDGTGFVDDTPSVSSSFINSDNGFFPGDNSPTDGNVTSKDKVGYFWRTKVSAGPARTVDVRLEIPQYLEFKAEDNSTFCVNISGVTSSFLSSATNPGCRYTIKPGQSFSTGVLVTLTAKDTSGTVQENQIVKTTNSQTGVYSSDSAAPVTVISAPAADLVLRPAQCSVSGSCSSINYETTSSSFVITPEILRWQGYDSNKGSSAAGVWSAKLDVSEMPTGTVYKIGSNVLTPDSSGMLNLRNMSGSVTVAYTVPAKWGLDDDEFVAGSSTDFRVHLIVNEGSLSTEDYLNNGDGWQPGQGKESSVSTFNERESGARRGYFLNNNDWTLVKIHRNVPPVTGGTGILFTKTIERPWSSRNTLWEDENKIFTPSGSKVSFSSTGSSQYRKVTEGTQIKSNVTIYPSNNPSVVLDKTVVLMDTWNTDEIRIAERPYLVDQDGNPLTGFTTRIQWSPNVVGEAGADHTNNSGWFNTNPASVDPASVKSVRAIIENVDLGEGGDNKISLVVPQVVVDPYKVEYPDIFSDTMYGSVGDMGSVTTLTNYVTPVTSPVRSVGLTATHNPALLDRDKNLITYNYKPTITGLTSTTDPVKGQVDFTVSACITNINILSNSTWEMVGSFTPGTGCMTSNPQPGTFSVKTVGDGVVPGEFNAVSGIATLPDVRFTANVNPVVVGDIDVVGTWTATSPVAALPSQPVTRTTNAGDYELTTPTLETSTPKVEINEVAKFKSSIIAKNLAETTLDAESILILPGRGNDSKFLDVLGDVTGNTLYTGPTSSVYDGDYLVSHLSIDTNSSAPGSTIVCTRVTDPSMDPADYQPSDWSADCVDNASNKITAVKLIQPAGQDAAGVRVNIELQTSGNTIDNNYLMWLGPIYVAGEAKSIVWPVNNVVVASKISGYTYWDSSGKGVARNEDSAPIEGIAVELLNEAGEVVDSTTTDATGFYEFTKLHSGKYTTRVPEIGETGGVPAKVDSRFIAGNTIDVSQTFSYPKRKLGNSRSQSGEINLGIDATVENVNYGYFAPDPYSDLLKKPAEIVCAVGANTCDVEWEVTVKNGGEPYDPSRVVQVVDRGSGGSALLGSGRVFAWGYGYRGANGNGRTNNNLTPEIVQGLDGVFVKEIFSTGFALTSTNKLYAWGNGLNGSNGNGSTSNNLTAQPVQGLGGVTIKKFVDRYSGGYVLSDDGKVYSFGNGEFGANGNGSDSNNLTAQLVQGLSGVNIVDVFDREGSGGYALTDDGEVYSWGRGDRGSNGDGSADHNTTAQLVQGLSGVEVEQIIPRNTDRAYAINTEGAYVITTSGEVYSWGRGARGSNGDGSTTDDDNLTAEIVQGLSGKKIIKVVSRGPSVPGGYALAESGEVYAWGLGSRGANGNGSQNHNMTAQIVKGLSDKHIVDVVAHRSPVYPGGYALSSDGEVFSWGGAYTGAAYILTAKKALGLDSVRVKEIYNRLDGGFAVTDTGEIYSWGSGNNYLNGNGSTANTTSAQIVQGLDEIVVDKLIKRGELSGGYVIDSEGQVYAWGYGGYGSNGNGSTNPNPIAQKVKNDAWMPAVPSSDSAAPVTLTNGKLTDSTSSEVYDVEVRFEGAESSIVTPVSEVPNGDFVTREYNIGTFEPDEEKTVLISGKVNKISYESNGGLGLVIGNQASASFEEAPRSAPELPTLPAYNTSVPFDFGQISGNSTCIATDDWVVFGDQCGQVFAQLPASDQQLGSLSGYAFWDQNNNGTQDSSEPMITGVKVALYQGINESFSNKVGETTTDLDGFYKFNNIVPSTNTSNDGYYVVFMPADNPKVSSDGSRTGDMLDEGQAWVYTNQYNESPYFAENVSAVNENGVTRNVAVLANQTTIPVNAGLSSYDAGIAVDKGADPSAAHRGSFGLTDEVEIELDPARPGYTKPISVKTIAQNTGSEPLENIVFTDVNNIGPKVIWQSCSISSPYSDDIDMTGTSWVGDNFTHAFGSSVTMNEGAVLDCYGTFPAMKVEDLPSVATDLVHQDTATVSGVGSITGLIVNDTDNFQIFGTELPTPSVKIEKGFARPLEEGVGIEEGVDIDCSFNGDHLMWDEACAIDSGTEADPIEVEMNKEYEVVFRVTNTGEEPLMNMSIDDITTIGSSKVEITECYWPTILVEGTEGNLEEIPYLGNTTGFDDVGTCVGTLVMSEIGDTHQNEASIYAVGEISGKFATDSAEFNAKVPDYEAPGINLPNSGGTTALIFGMIAILLAVISVGTFAYNKRRENV